jgi:hypothetical protein
MDEIVILNFAENITDFFFPFYCFGTISDEPFLVHFVKGIKVHSSLPSKVYKIGLQM